MASAQTLSLPFLSQHPWEAGLGHWAWGETRPAGLVPPSLAPHPSLEAGPTGSPSQAVHVGMGFTPTHVAFLELLLLVLILMALI